MTIVYQIEDVFTTDPTLSGWAQKQGVTMDWDSVEKVGGNLGVDANCRYIKFLGKPLTQEDNITALFTVMVDNAAAGTGKAIVGFFNVSESEGKDECFGLLIDTSTGNIRPQIYVAYDDGTKLTGAGAYGMTDGTKYVIAIRYVPEDGLAYIQIYDFVTQQLLWTDSVSIDSTKTFELNQVGISEHSTAFVTTAEAWIYDMYAVAEPEPVVYADLYCTPGEARSLTNLDAVQDMTDDSIAQLETIFAIPQVNSRFRSEGYPAPFDTGDDTPPLVRTITALLTAAYAARKSYVSVDPSDSPVYKDLLGEVNKLWKDILDGMLELLDKNGDLMERGLATSTDMLSTTEGQLNLFTLDDVPDIDTVMSGRLYIGRPGS